VSTALHQHRSTASLGCHRFVLFFCFISPYFLSFIIAPVAHTRHRPLVMDKVTSIITVSTSGGVLDHASTAAGITDSEESLCPSLNFKQRLQGCAVCGGIGLIFLILSWVTVFLMQYALFGVLFSVGSLALLGSTFFLAGPLRQLKNMFSEGRWIASTVYIITLVLTIVCAVVLGSGILTIIMCIIQLGALAWYILSYIPFARDAVKAAISSLLNK
jgi:flagellar biosynthesis protein FlhB